MQMFFKVAVEIPAFGSMTEMVRTFCFASRQEAENFTKLVEQVSRGAKIVERWADLCETADQKPLAAPRIVGTSIDHLMTAKDALEEIDEEIEMAMRVAYTEQL